MDYQKEYHSLGPGFEPDSAKNPGRIPFWVILFVAGSLLLAVVSMTRFPKVFSEYKVYIKAENRMEKGETGEALSELLLVLEAHPNSLPVITRLIDLSMEAGYYDVAAYVFNEYLVGKDLTDSQYSRMMGYSRQLEHYYDTYDAIDAITGEIADLNPGSEEEAAAVRAQVREELTSLLGGPDIGDAMLYYMLGYFSETSQERYEYLLLGYKADPECYDIRVQLANTARTLGKLDEAEIYLNQALAKEHSASGALRGMAVLRMLQGDAGEGLTLARQAYELDPDGTYIRDTYLIALHVNGETQEEETIAAEIREVQGSLEEDTLAFLEGSCTLQEYYMETAETGGV